MILDMSHPQPTSLRISVITHSKTNPPHLFDLNRLFRLSQAEWILRHCGQVTIPLARAIARLMFLEIQETGASEEDRENGTVNTALPEGFGRMAYREQALWFLQDRNVNTARWVSGVMLHAISNL